MFVRNCLYCMLVGTIISFCLNSIFLRVDSQRGHQLRPTSVWCTTRLRATCATCAGTRVAPTVNCANTAPFTAMTSPTSARLALSRKCTLHTNVFLNIRTSYSRLIDDLTNSFPNAIFSRLSCWKKRDLSLN